jgi:four helix bundle protein
MADFMRVEDLVVYQKLCELHLQVCACTKSWPADERFELVSQIRRSSNGAPANLAEKHSDRHIRNKIEGANRARGEVLETIHHLFIAKLKGYVADNEYEHLSELYVECVRMLNGLERALAKQLPESQRRWASDPPTLNPEPGTLDPQAEPRTLNPEP